MQVVTNHSTLHTAVISKENGIGKGTKLEVVIIASLVNKNSVG